MNSSSLPQPSRLCNFLAGKTGVFAACACIAALDLVLYRKSLSLYFIQDDFYYLWFTSDQSIRGFIKLFAQQHIFYRPISNYLYFYLMQTAFGTNPFPYHLLNLLIHVFNSLATGYLVYLMTRNRVLAITSAVIFTSRIGHVIAIYWICVSTQSMPLMFFLLSLILYIRYLENGRPSVLVWSYLSFVFCAFSNINGPTLVALVTLYDILSRDNRSFLSILKSESGFYVIVATFLFLQFVVFGYHPPKDYRINVGLLALRNFGVLNLFSCNTLYLANYLGGAPPVMLAAGVLAGIATISGALICSLRNVVEKPNVRPFPPKPESGLAHSESQNMDSRLRGNDNPATMHTFYPDNSASSRSAAAGKPAPYLFFGLWYIWGFAPYLPLSEHVWPQYITTAAVGLSFLSAALLTRLLKPKMLAAALCLIVAVSFLSVRLFEREEYDTRGIIYKSALARNVVSDFTRSLSQQPDVDKVIVLDGTVDLWWILHYGKYAEVFTGKVKPIFYLNSSETIRPDPATLVLRFENMRLHKVP
ncbi:hypothetical protein HZA56_16750 [Candidatus Poribacteria bacterium]|nr:hypothetical protein [Candidatus Poribacteria bacterium]